jgi:hypothetical protein
VSSNQEWRSAQGRVEKRACFGDNLSLEITCCVTITPYGLVCLIRDLGAESTAESWSGLTGLRKRPRRDIANARDVAAVWASMRAAAEAASSAGGRAPS